MFVDRLTVFTTTTSLRLRAVYCIVCRARPGEEEEEEGEREREREEEKREKEEEKREKKEEEEREKKEEERREEERRVMCTHLSPPSFS